MHRAFITEAFIKSRFQSRARCSFAHIVSAKALFNEVREDTVKGLDTLPEEMNYRAVT